MLVTQITRGGTLRRPLSCGTRLLPRALRLLHLRSLSGSGINRNGCLGANGLAHLIWPTGPEGHVRPTRLWSRCLATWAKRRWLEGGSVARFRFCHGGTLTLQGLSQLHIGQCRRCIRVWGKKITILFTRSFRACTMHCGDMQQSMRFHAD